MANKDGTLDKEDKGQSAENLEKNANNVDREEEEDRYHDLPEQAMIDPEVAVRNPEMVGKISLHQLVYSIAGLILGLVCVIGGIILFLRGITGSTSWTAKLLGMESNISDAAPGAVLFIVGLFVVLITRYVLNIRK